MSQATQHSHPLVPEATAHVIAGKVISMSRHDAPPSAAVHGAGIGIPAAVANRQLPTDEELREISASLRGLRYGSVTVVVQDGVIIQIDRVEKRRLRTRREGGENNSR
jgi:hypothetical protein